MGWGGEGGGATGWTLGLDYVQSQPYPHNRHVGTLAVLVYMLHLQHQNNGQLRENSIRIEQNKKLMHFYITMQY